jgi:flagellar hook-associated protein 1 FlgK
VGLSIGLDIATQALRAQQRAVDVTSHNIANANTPGFSRQEIELRSLSPLRASGFAYDRVLNQVGRGVEPSEIRRLRDRFVDFQIRNVLDSAAQYRARADALARAETAFAEPSETGLSALLTRFWNSWRELSNAPESTAARANVVQTATTLAEGFRRVDSQLSQQRRELDTSISQVVDEVNLAITTLAGLNDQIRHARLNGSTANDLEDQRDLILDELAQKIGATAVEGDDGMVSVSFNGQQIVNGTTWRPLATQPGTGGFTAIVFGDDGSSVSFSMGEVAGLLDIRDNVLPAKLAGIDQIAATVIAQVNAVHQASFGLNGATGLDFFAGTDAGDMAVDSAILATPASIGAAAAAGAPGDGSRALALAGLQQALTMNGSTATIDDFYRGFIGQLGIEVSEARNIAENEQGLADHLEDLRQSVSGVNLDEEMVNLVKYQHAYNAAGRLITVVDEMLDRLINGTGVAGR